MTSTQSLLAETTQRSYFDEHGRCIPTELSSPVHQKTRRYFQIQQPVINYAEIFERIATCLGTPKNLSVESFEAQAKGILADLKKDEHTAALLDGIAIPFFLPQADYADIGLALEQTFIPAVHKSYGLTFPQYQFVSHIVGSMEKLLKLDPASRHGELIEKMKQGDVVGYYFPCLTEYSIPAAREMMAKLPESFLLSGGYDTMAAVIATPELLFNKEKYPPLLWLAALEGDNPEAGYHFEAYGYNLTFNRKIHLGKEAEYWNAGLTVLA